MKLYLKKRAIKRIMSVIAVLCLMGAMFVGSTVVFAQSTNATLTLTLEDGLGAELDGELQPDDEFDLVVTLSGLTANSKVYSLAVNVIYDDTSIETLAIADNLLDSGNSSGIIYDGFLDGTTPDVFGFSTPEAGGIKSVKLLWMSTEEPYDGSGFDGSDIELMRIPFKATAAVEADALIFTVDDEGETTMAYGATGFYTLDFVDYPDLGVADNVISVVGVTGSSLTAETPYKATVYTINETAANITPILIVTAYDDSGDAVKNVYFEYKAATSPIAQDGTKRLSVDFEIPAEATTAKITLWDGINTMVPMAVTGTSEECLEFTIE